MTGTYPVLLDGKHKGTLRVTQEGLNTIFEIRCEHPGRMVRLSVYGQGREGYLGVPAPEGSSLVLRRRLSRAAMAGFPEKMVAGGAGGERGAAAPAAKAPERERSPARPASGQEAQAGPRPGNREGAGKSPSQNGASGSGGTQEENPAAEPRDTGGPGPNPEGGTELIWYRLGDGSLFTAWQGRQFRAVPLPPHGMPLGRLVEKRVIEGVEYGVFELRDGRMS